MSILRKVLVIAAGNLLVAFAVVFFILPQNILSGGVPTVAMILANFVPLSRVTLIAILNVTLFLAGWLVLGRKFALSSVLSTILYPTFVSLLSLADTKPFASIDPLLAAFYSGCLCGIGLGLVFRVHASTGGMDIPALILHKYTPLQEGQCVMIVDGLTILAGLYVYGLNAVLTGLLAVIASTLTINWTQTLGAQPAKKILIISEKWQEIESYLLDDVSRGVTILEGQGAWSNEKRPVLMCVVSNREYSHVEHGVSTIDPRAFLIVNDVHEVRGSGFTYKDGSFE